MEKLKYKAYAKVNLTMDVLRKREDGYHDVDLLMQSVSLHDELTFENAETLFLTIEGGLPVEDNNLVLRAARRLAENAGVTPYGHVHLKKNIPVAAGLGGGSADCAAALVGFAKLWGLNYTQDDLAKLGAPLGADVPFCVLGGTKRCVGIGTDLENVDSRLPLHLVIIKPCEGLLTREIYESLRFTEEMKHPSTEGAIRAVESGSLEALFPCMGNVMEKISVEKRPGIAEAIARLNENGAAAARMSGSGSAVFGLFETKEKAENAAKALREKYKECFAAESVRFGVECV